MTPETYMRRYHAGCGCDEEAATVTAEELFPACALNASDCGCGCGQTDPDPDPTCCCKASMAEALQLLCGETIGSLVDFDAFFFLTDSLALGSSLTIPGADTDNIGTPAASLRRFAPCNCDLLDVDGTAYFAVPDQAGLALETVSQLSLCSIKAVAFQLATADEADGETVYRRAVRAIRRAIQTEGGCTGACGVCQAHCDCDDCCCASGILSELATRNLSRTATLTAGPLVLQNVTVLGSIGSVLVLASEELERIYFVCANAVEALS